MPPLLLLLLLAPAAGAAGPRTVVLRAARMFDGKGDAAVSPGIVVVRGPIIQAAGPAAAVPEGAEVIDLGDATLLPGFVDAHTHLTSQRSDDASHDQLDRLKKTVAERALEAAGHARKTLLAGFTTVRNLGADQQIDVGLRNAIRSGATPGPRMVTAARSIGSTGGHCDGTNGFPPGTLADRFGEGVADGPEAIRAMVRRQVKLGADVVKVCATGGVLSEGDEVDTPQLTQAELDALVGEAHALRKKAAAHAHGAEGAKRAIRAGIDSIEHGSFLDDEALDLMVKRGTWLVPTLLAVKSLEEQIARGARMPEWMVRKTRAAAAHARRTFARALARGVRVAFGTDAGVFAHGRNAEEFALMVEAGMKPAAALRAATSSAAELLGLADRIGTLEAGKLADVVAVPGDPTREIRQAEKVLFVMAEGAVVRNDRAAPAR